MKKINKSNNQNGTNPNDGNLIHGNLNDINPKDISSKSVNPSDISKKITEMGEINADHQIEDRLFEEKDQKDEFWILMGPFFASKSVRKELPYIMNQPGQTWFLICENKAVIGFVSGILRKDFWYLDNIYVIPEYRERNLLVRLILQFMTYYSHQDPEKKVRLETQNPIIRDFFIKHHFSSYKSTKTWYFLEGSIFGDK